MVEALTPPPNARGLSQIASTFLKMANLMLICKKLIFHSRVEPAISPGSVFQFRSAKHDETLASALAALELYAIGSYKPHGCGQVVIEKPW
ncbi:MAG: hypothetical protein AOA66_0408 [Candidatus Bathyarchaeota archaeon BA2]|nr:MAG: hypothetical protein AOA66_0408 [Candidatus Bathyarchaeota archaeon BA2]